MWSPRPDVMAGRSVANRPPPAAPRSPNGWRSTTVRGQGGREGLLCAVRENGRRGWSSARSKDGGGRGLLACDATKQGSPVAGVGLVEDGFQVILNGVLGEVQVERECACIGAQCEPFEHLGFAGCQPVAAGVEGASFGQPSPKRCARSSATASCTSTPARWSLPPTRPSTGRLTCPAGDCSSSAATANHSFGDMSTKLEYFPGWLAVSLSLPSSYRVGAASCARRVTMDRDQYRWLEAWDGLGMACALAAGCWWPTQLITESRRWATDGSRPETPHPKSRRRWFRRAGTTPQLKPRGA